MSVGVSTERTVEYRGIVGHTQQYSLKRKQIYAYSDLSLACAFVQLFMITLNIHGTANHYCTNNVTLLLEICDWMQQRRSSLDKVNHCIYDQLHRDRDIHNHCGTEQRST